MRCVLHQQKGSLIHLEWEHACYNLGVKKIAVNDFFKQNLLDFSLNFCWEWRFCRVFFPPFSYWIANLSVACVSAASSTFHSDVSFSSLHQLMAKTVLVTGISLTLQNIFFHLFPLCSQGKGLPHVPPWWIHPPSSSASGKCLLRGCQRQVTAPFWDVFSSHS